MEGKIGHYDTMQFFFFFLRGAVKKNHCFNQRCHIYCNIAGFMDGLTGEGGRGGASARNPKGDYIAVQLIYMQL